MSNRAGQHPDQAYREGTRSLEWALAFLMVGWGTVLLLPGETLDNPSYRWIAVLAPEAFWASLSIWVGALRLIALTINGRWRRTPLLRLAGAVLGFVWFLTLGVLLWLSVSELPAGIPGGLAFYVVCAGAEAWSCWRSAQDAYFARSFARPRFPRNQRGAQNGQPAYRR